MLLADPALGMPFGFDFPTSMIHKCGCWTDVYDCNGCGTMTPTRWEDLNALLPRKGDSGGVLAELQRSLEKVDVVGIFHAVKMGVTTPWSEYGVRKTQPFALAH